MRCECPADVDAVALLAEDVAVVAVGEDGAEEVNKTKREKHNCRIGCAFCLLIQIVVEILIIIILVIIFIIVILFWLLLLLIIIIRR